MKSSSSAVKILILRQLITLHKYQDSQRGYVLVAASAMIVLLSGLFLTASIIGQLDSLSTQGTKVSNQGSFTAEAGLNLRAQLIRNKFQGYNKPTGFTPINSTGQIWENCIDGNASNDGSGDFACDSSLYVNGQRLVTYVEELNNGEPRSIVITDGIYTGLSALEYQYEVYSVALDNKFNQDIPSSMLGLRFNNRLVPLFQFAAFYNKDLEIHPGPPMVLSGPIHTNGDLYLNGRVQLEGKISTVNQLWRGNKDPQVCSGSVSVLDGSTNAFPSPSPVTINCQGTGRSTIDDVSPWNGQIVVGADTLTVPTPDLLEPAPSSESWSKADLRIALQLDSAENVAGIEVRDVRNNNDSTRTATLSGCNAVTTSNTFRNFREAPGANNFKLMRMLDVDIRALLDCAQDNNLLEGNRRLDDDTEGGLVWHLTVDGPQSNINVYAGGRSVPLDGNNYGVRLYNGGTLQSTVAGAPEIRGLTIVSDQAIYIQGNYNCGTGTLSDSSCSFKKPAAIMADTINILSSAWPTTGDYPNTRLPRADHTFINAAFLAGTDVTGGAEGISGQNGAQNGGLPNYPRFHEDWGDRELVYRGSFVSLTTPKRVSGPHDASAYFPPIRNWNFDVDFQDAGNLPPLTPRFVYLQQELFQRDFSQLSAFNTEKNSGLSSEFRLSSENARFNIQFFL